jgi:hypothetical protein
MALCRTPYLQSVCRSAKQSLPSVSLCRVSCTRYKQALYRAQDFAECGARQSLICRVPDKKHLAKPPALGKDPDSGSDPCTAVVVKRYDHSGKHTSRLLVSAAKVTLAESRFSRRHHYEMRHLKSKRKSGVNLI